MRHVTKTAEVTGFPECLDGRVKTLHPKIHGGPRKAVLIITVEAIEVEVAADSESGSQLESEPMGQLEAPSAAARSGELAGADSASPDGVVVPPRLVKVVVPELPASIRRHRRVTEVPLLVLVTAAGEISDVRVAQPTGCPPCEAEAVRAARRLRFAPATQGGRPVDAWYPFAFRFGR